MQYVIVLNVMLYFKYMLNVIMLKVVMLKVVMQRVIILNVIMLSVMVPLRILEMGQNFRFWASRFCKPVSCDREY